MTSPEPFVRYQYSDHLGSATLETNEDAELISYEEYHPYGTTAYSTYVNSHSYSTKRFRFTNKERDDETGLYYFGVRYYAAWLGRWTSSDPGGFIDGLNLYRYVRNSPVNLTDPDGMSPDGPPPDGEDDLGLEQIEDYGGGDGSFVQDTTVIAEGKPIILNAKKETSGFNIDPDLDLVSIAGNPEYEGLTTADIRTSIKRKYPNLEEWKINISAGHVLEIAYGEFSGMTRGKKEATYTNKNEPWMPGGPDRYVIPDYNHSTATQVCEDQALHCFYTFKKGGVVEVKASQNIVTLTMNKRQIDGEISLAANAWTYDRFMGDRARNYGAGSFTLVLTSDGEFSEDITKTATEKHVDFYASYAFIHKKTGRIVFSNPTKINNLSYSKEWGPGQNAWPSILDGAIIPPLIEKSADFWNSGKWKKGHTPGTNHTADE